MQMVARLPDAVMPISLEVIPTDFLSPFRAAVTIIGGSYRTILTSASDVTHIRTVRYAHPFRTVRVGQVTDHASRTAHPGTVVEYMKCVTYELEVTITLYRNQKRDKPFCYGLSLEYNHHP